MSQGSFQKAQLPAQAFLKVNHSMCQLRWRTFRAYSLDFDKLAAKLVWPFSFASFVLPKKDRVVLQFFGNFLNLIFLYLALNHFVDDTVHVLILSNQATILSLRNFKQILRYLSYVHRPVNKLSVVLRLGSA